MKKGTLIIVMTMVMLPALAQLRPQYTQYILNHYIINPAVAGIEPYTDIKLGHRQQWVGIEDAPVTSYITVHGSIGATRENTNPTSRVPDGENPRGTYYWDNYMSAEPHHGWGVTVFNDKTGPISRLAAYGTYAYHVGLSATTSISGGINLGIVRNSLDMSKLEFDDPNDPVLGNSQQFNRMRPDLGAGIWLYSRSFFGGVSVMQILSREWVQILWRCPISAVSRYLLAPRDSGLWPASKLILFPQWWCGKQKDCLWASTSMRKPYILTGFGVALLTG